jgi:peptide deformylase
MLTLVTGATTEMLKKKTALVADALAPEIQALLPEMEKTMRKEKGVGLAAPQIGHSLRLAIAEADGILYTLINPEITSLSQEKILFEEGCLSLPKEYFPIIRSESLTLKYLDERGLPKKVRATGFLAIVIQHEVDHLDGILICDRYAKQHKNPQYKKLYGTLE